MENLLEEAIKEAESSLANYTPEAQPEARDTSKDIYIYKIRRKKDGFFASGGMDGRFDKKGKVWGNIGSLKNHLVLSNTSQYKDAQVVKYRLDLLSEVDVSWFRKEEMKNSKAYKVKPEVEDLPF